VRGLDRGVTPEHGALVAWLGVHWLHGIALAEYARSPQVARLRAAAPGEHGAELGGILSGYPVCAEVSLSS